MWSIIKDMVDSIRPVRKIYDAKQNKLYIDDFFLDQDIRGMCELLFENKNKTVVFVVSQVLSNKHSWTNILNNLIKDKTSKQNKQLFVFDICITDFENKSNKYIEFVSRVIRKHDILVIDCYSTEIFNNISKNIPVNQYLNNLNLNLNFNQNIFRFVQQMTQNIVPKHIIWCSHKCFDKQNQKHQKVLIDEKQAPGLAIHYFEFDIHSNFICQTQKNNCIQEITTTSNITKSRIIAQDISNFILFKIYFSPKNNNNNNNNNKNNYPKRKQECRHHPNQLQELDSNPFCKTSG